MKTKTTDIKVKKDQFNFNSFDFKRDIVKLRREFSLLDKYSQIDTKKMQIKFEV